MYGFITYLHDIALHNIVLVLVTHSHCRWLATAYQGVCFDQSDLRVIDFTLNGRRQPEWSVTGIQGTVYPAISGTVQTHHCEHCKHTLCRSNSCSRFARGVAWLALQSPMEPFATSHSHQTCSTTPSPLASVPSLSRRHSSSCGCCPRTFTCYYFPLPVLASINKHIAL